MYVTRFLYRGRKGYTENMQDAKEEVRARLNIEDVISEYVQLKRAGRNFKGLSPFTGERTPSFTVSPEKHIWHDFSSGKGGDVFSFVMEVEGLDFRGALELLARKAGVDLTQYDSKKSGDIARKKRRLIEANELAARYYQQCLVSNPHAVEYVFKTRKLSKDIVQEFKIGYAPDDGDALVKVLVKKGFTKRELSEAGLLNRFDTDLFRGRMTVPLMDPSGQVIGFTGRIIKDDPKAPKYLNTPQTLIYDKSRHAFGLSQAKDAIRSNDFSVIVEGNLDVVSSHQAGIKNVVASAGTALTEWHLKALSRLSQHVKLSFDADKAGLAATERSIPIASAVGVELTIISLPEGAKDPDELIQVDPNVWKSVTEKSEPVVDWVLRQYAARVDMLAASGKRTFTTEAIKVVKLLDDSVVREHYLRKIAELTETSFEAIEAKYQTGETSNSTQTLKTVKQSDARDASTEYPHEDNLLAVLAMNPASRHHLEGFDIAMLHEAQRQQLASWLLANAGPVDPTPAKLKDIDTYVKIVSLKAESRYEGWSEQDSSLEAAKLLRHITIEHKKQTKDQLIEQLRHAESDGDDERARELRARLHALIKEMA